MSWLSVLTSKDPRAWLIGSILGTYTITAVHHAYGAWLYDTPWRNHIVSQGAIWSLICLFLFFVYLKWNQKWAYWIFFLLSFFFYFGALGLYEGFYNHLIKNVLYFADISEALLHQLFPPPKYELPNDFLFEFTGILTFLAGALSGWSLIQYTKIKNETRKI